MSRRRPFRFFPRVECLEGRIVPAGILVTKISTGVLTITGQDNPGSPALESQHLALLGGGLGHVSISAMDGETISGKNSFNGVNKVVLKMGNGDDEVTIVNLKVSAVDFQGGSGDNGVFFDGEDIDIGSFSASSGTVATAATDSFSMGPSNQVKSHFLNFTVNCPYATCDLVLGGMGVDRVMRVTTSNTGNDVVAMDDDIINTFILSTGGGNDSIILGNLDQNDGEELLFNGDATIKLGSGDDTFVAGVNVHDPSGGPDLKPDFTRFKKHVYIDASTGNDTISTHHPRSTEFALANNPRLDNFETIIYDRYDPVFTTDSAISIDHDGTTAVMTVKATDLDNDPVTFSIVGGDDGGAFTITSGGDLSFQSAPDFLNPTDANGDNVYVVEVQASDGRLGTTVQTIKVTVNNSTPTISSSDTVDVLENTTAVLVLTATDADEDPVTYTIVGGPDAARFNLTSNGILTFKVAPDYENPTDTNANNVYVVKVKVTDGLAFSTQTIQVTVLDDPLA